MSREVQLQADVGSLGLQGLGAFTSILATLSADNIVSMALIQMEKLGIALPTSGEYAERVKDLLRRCNDVRLDHLALVIGWRKNDTASLMAESAGGQAIALLSMCLTSLFKHSDTGTILARLCKKLCSHSANVSSVAQLADVAKLLAGKVDALGFGNLLAKEVRRVHSAYEALGHTSVPAKLLERLSIEFVTDMLDKISHGLCQEHRICRISGSRGMGHVVGLVQALIPRDTVLTIEGVVIQDVEHPKIRCDIFHGDTDGLTQIQLETSLSHTLPIKWPIKPVDPTSNPVYHDTTYSFGWSRWLADYLRLIFMNYGLRCDRSILEACCNLLVHIPVSLDIGTSIPSSKMDRTENIPTTPLLALLGPLPQARMCSICENLLDCSPTGDHTDIQTAFKALVAAVSYVARGLTCRCTQDRCEWSLGWGFDNAKALEPRKRCQRYQLWEAIGNALNFGVCSFFIDAGPNTSIRPRDGYASYESSWYITKAIRKDQQNIVNPKYFLEDIFSLIASGPEVLKNSIITSSESSTVYPRVLTDLRLPSRQLVTFLLVDGQIVYEHRYHRHLCAAQARARPKERRGLMATLSPSHIGAHSGSPLLTIREGFRFLEIQCSVEYAKNEVGLNLKEVILGYIAMRWTSICAHPVTDNMDPFKYAPLATSIASPSAAGRLGVAMTRWNPVAQFLCCENGNQAILQRECCLNCAAETLGIRTNAVIIVG